jgi:hypothetical protein
LEGWLLTEPLMATTHNFQNVQHRNRKMKTPGQRPETSKHYQKDQQTEQTVDSRAALTLGQICEKSIIQ